MNTPIVDPDLAATLRRLKLGQILDTLPERLTLAKTNKLSHAEFLQILLSDEVTRRDSTSATLRAKTAGLDPSMTLDRWDPTSPVTYNSKLFDELVSLRFNETANNVIIMGPVGVGKTFLATALGHIAIRRRHSVHFERADKLFKRLRASRLDNSHDTEIRKLLRVEMLIIDDFALATLDTNDTSTIYEIIVERHRRTSTIITSNREPNEWITLMTDPLLAQSAIDRLTSAAHELIIEGDSYRTRQRPQIT
jgi:DNA replication protein DnaC